MIRRMLGALLGGTTVGGHHGLESVAVSLITPPNFGSGGGSCFPSMVVVAPGEPGVPVVWICARVEGATAMTAAASIPLRRICLACFIGIIWLVVVQLIHLNGAQRRGYSRMYMSWLPIKVDIRSDQSVKLTSNACAPIEEATPSVWPARYITTPF